MKTMHFFPIAVVFSLFIAITACQKTDDLVGENNGSILFSTTSDQLTDNNTSASEDGSVELRVISKSPFAFEIKRFNKNKRQVWSATYGIEAPYSLSNMLVEVQADQSILISSDIHGTGVQNVFLAKLDAYGELLWNKRAGNQRPIEIVDKIDDPEKGSFINLVEISDDGTEAYVMVYICTAGELEFATQYSSSVEKPSKRELSDAGDQIHVLQVFNSNTAEYLIDKKDGRVSDVKFDHEELSKLPDHGTPFQLETSSLRMRKKR
jgi:hypothetical protein